MIKPGNDNIRWYRLEFDVPIQQKDNGWGASGKAALEIDNVEYHPLFDNSWTYRRNITIDNTGNSNSLANYPVRVPVQNYSGTHGNYVDLRFTDSDLETELYYWIETSNESSAIVWVNVTSIPGSSTKTICMYYGNSTATAPLFNETDVFFRVNQSAVAMWHMDEGTGNDIYDETPNGNTGTISGASWVSGAKFNKALNFSTGDVVTISDSSSSDFGTSNFTIVAWFKTDTDSGSARLISKMGGSKQVFIRMDSGIVRSYIADGTYAKTAASTNTYNDDKWHLIVASFDRGGLLRQFIDGSLDGTEAIHDVENVDMDGSLKIGLDNGQQYTGLLDEVAIYKSAFTLEEAQDLSGGYFDYISNAITRNYSYPEPYVSLIGDEETLGSLGNISYSDFSFSPSLANPGETFAFSIYVDNPQNENTTVTLNILDESNSTVATRTTSVNGNGTASALVILNNIGNYKYFWNATSTSYPCGIKYPENSAYLTGPEVAYYYIRNFEVPANLPKLTGTVIWNSLNSSYNINIYFIDPSGNQIDQFDTSISTRTKVTQTVIPLPLLNDYNITSYDGIVRMSVTNPESGNWQIIVRDDEIEQFEADVEFVM